VFRKEFDNGTLRPVIILKSEFPNPNSQIRIPKSEFPNPKSKIKNQQPTLPLEFRWLGRVAYQAALDLQRELVEKRLENRVPDTVLLLEHEPVYTIGRTRDHSSLGNTDSLPFPVVEINRGGKATYHGPGQLVAYPILDLTKHGKDLHRYLRALEDTIISACREFAVSAARREGLTGVWIGEKKIASIGVGVKKWISMHGFALNVSGDLAPFNTIVPCGIENVTMTSVARESAREVTVQSMAESIQPHLVRELLKLRTNNP
jgi:lipoyl(octanoyl) transferase